MNLHNFKIIPRCIKTIGKVNIPLIIEVIEVCLWKRQIEVKISLASGVFLV